MDSKAFEKIMACFLSAILMASVTHAASYEFDDQARLLTVTVGSGEESFDASYASYLTGNRVTNVVKRGVGTLAMGSTDRSAYTGDFTVKAGTLSYAGNNALGSLSTGTRKIFVENGATLMRNGGGALKGKTVYFEGLGVNEGGALRASGSVDNPWGQNVAMTGDALIVGNGECNFTYGTTFEMRGHTLTVRQQNNTNLLLGFKGVNFYKLGTTEPSPGTIIVDQGKFYVADGRNWVAADGIGKLILTNSASFRISGLYPSAKLQWPWVWSSTNPTFDLHQNAADKGFDPYQTWNAPFEISGVPVLDIRTLSNTPRNADIAFAGKVSGGGFSIVGTGNMAEAAGGNPHLHLLNQANDFTNGVSATLASVHLPCNGALPASGGSLILTNAAAYLNESETYDLPGLEVSGTGIVNNAKGAWRKGVVKRGEGEFRYDSLLKIPSLTVEGGSVRLPASGELKGNPLAGLIGGVTYSTYSGCTRTFVTTNAVELSPSAMYDGSHRFWTETTYLPSGEADPDKHRVVTYAGYLWNRTGADVTWNFAGCAYIHFALFVNGVPPSSSQCNTRCVALC